MQRLTLIRHATTVAVRAAAFPLDEPLDRAGREAAAGVRAALVVGDGASVWCGPSQRARETATLLGLDRPVVDAALDECDFGRWRGRTLEAVHAEEPEAVAAWMQDPQAAPHGGESLVALTARVSAWLAGRAAQDGETVAITSGGVIRAAVAAALGAPATSSWRIDVRPLHATVLHGHDGRWTVRSVNLPLAADALGDGAPRAVARSTRASRERATADHADAGVAGR